MHDDEADGAERMPRVLARVSGGETDNVDIEACDVFAVRYLNLSRRTDRLHQCQHFLASAGLSDFAERVESHDGNELWSEDLLRFRCAGAVTREALASEEMREGWVMGGDMTSGAAALCATTRDLLMRYADDASAPPFLVVFEDDVDIAAGQRPSAVRELCEHLAGEAGAAAREAPWDVLLLGSHPESEVKDAVIAPLPPTCGGSMRPVGNFFGLFGYVARTAALREVCSALFPCDQQIDSAMSEAAAEGAIRVLHVGNTLVASPKSSPSNTDVQRMDRRSFVDSQRAKLVASGQIQSALAQHPEVTRQIEAAYQEQFLHGASAHPPTPPAPAAPAAAVKKVAETKATERKAVKPTAAPIAKERVFVALAAFEDGELISTVKSLLSMAASPHRVVIGIVWQGAAGCPVLDPSALAQIEELWGANPTESPTPPSFPGAALGFASPKRRLGGRLRVLELPASEARGPCWARYLHELLWEGEEWYAQMDSHMRLTKHWDAECIGEVEGLERTGTANGTPTKPLLTCYGVGYGRGASHDWTLSLAEHAPPLVLAASHFDENNILQIRGSRAKRALAEPRRTFFFSAHFSFCRGERVAEVGYDPQLPYLFYGEEILFAVRCFTAGYDLYCPTRSYALHLWDKEYRPSYDAKLDGQQEEALNLSRARVASLLGQDRGPASTVSGHHTAPAAQQAASNKKMWPRPNGAPPEAGGSHIFGLGKVRSLDEYEKASGVSFRLLGMTEVARCGYLDAGELARSEEVVDMKNTLLGLTNSRMLDAKPTRPPSRALAVVGAPKKSVTELLAPPIDSGKVVVVPNALPPSFAREARAFLTAVPASDWEVSRTDDQPLDGGAERVQMHHRRNPRADTRALRERIRDCVLEKLELRPFERLIMNFSRYEPGDFLDSHDDTPSGSNSYERRLAFVWHLSDGWSSDDGGYFVDEEDGDSLTGERSYAPVFNTLVYFGVPRLHRVTKVTSNKKARFAVYGWVATPKILLAPTAAHLKEALRITKEGASATATAVLVLNRQPGARAASVLHDFASLPTEDVGLDRQLGDYVQFIVAFADDAPTRRALALDAASASGGDDACCLWVLSPQAVHPAGVLTGVAALESAGAMRRFLDIERKIWSPCAEIDMREPLQLTDMHFSSELKLIVFVAHAHRPAALLERFDKWGAFLKPHVRLYLAEPALCEPMLQDVGLGLRDAPTAVCLDTMARQEGRQDAAFRMADCYNAQRPMPPKSRGLDLPMLTAWTTSILKQKTPIGERASELSRL